MNTKEKNQAIKLINQAWDRIYYCIHSQASDYVISEYLKLNIQEEKRHDNFRPSGISRGITINQAGKFFAVKQIAEYLQGENPPDVKYYIDLRQSCFYAYSLAMKYREELQKALAEIDLSAIVALDYSKLVE